MSRAQEITNPNAITARQYRDRFEALPACPTAGVRLEQMCRSLPSETFWQLYTVPGPLPLTASRESDLFPASPQAACWRWNEILAAWGKLRSGRARSLLFPGRWWKEPETQAPTLGRSPRPPLLPESLRGVSTAVKNYSARAGRALSWRSSRSRDRGVVCNTHTCSFVWPDHVLCLHSSMWYHWRKSNQHWKFKEQPSSAGKRLGRGRGELVRQEAGPTHSQGKTWGWRGERLLWEKRDCERSKWTLMMIIISCIWKSFLADKAFSQLLSHLILTKTYDAKVPLLLENKEGEGKGWCPWTLDRRVWPSTRPSRAAPNTADGKMRETNS